jgi:hypothetical protein
MLTSFVVFLLNRINYIQFRDSSLDDVKGQGDGRELTNRETRGGYNPLMF